MATLQTLRFRSGRVRALVAVIVMLTTLIAGSSAPTHASSVPTCFGYPATIVGKHPGWLFGTNGSDVIVAADSGNAIYAGDGDDIICGGAGKDLIHGQGGSDWIFGGDGDDTLQGDFINWQGNNVGTGNDLIYGGTGDDTIYGGYSNDQLNGGDGHDRLSGGDGQDQLYGGTGNDEMVGGYGTDKLYGGAGRDILYDNYQLSASGGKNLLDGGSGIDHCSHDAFGENTWGWEPNQLSSCEVFTAWSWTGTDN